MSAAQHITSLATYSTGDAMVLDAPARRNLELTASLYDSAKAKSLLAVVDETRTPMGGRMLKKWLDAPLLSVERIAARLDAVESLYKNALTRADLRDALRPIADLERLLARLSTGTANARDLVALDEPAWRRSPASETTHPSSITQDSPTDSTRSPTSPTCSPAPSPTSRRSPSARETSSKTATTTASTNCARSAGVARAGLPPSKRRSASEPASRA